MKKRRYQLRQRAERMAETRRRIVEAAVALHTSVGPAATTISAVAESAGVERPTVYRHFPDEASLLRACRAHYFAVHPPPDPEGWRLVKDPHARLRVALGELYAYYADTASATAVLLRDQERQPDRYGGATGLRDAALAALLEPWRLRGRRAILAQAAIAHVVDFWAWRSLARTLGPADVLALAERFVSSSLAIDHAQFRQRPGRSRRAGTVRRS